VPAVRLPRRFSSGYEAFEVAFVGAGFGPATDEPVAARYQFAERFVAFPKSFFRCDAWGGAVMT
jgi:hypothetical protein